MTEATFPPFSAPGALAKGPPLELRKGTPFGRPLSVISGGGAFYDFNLDFGCCFGTLGSPANTEPDIASSGELLLQRPSYRTVLVNGSSAGVRFYPLNAEQDFGEAHTEIRYSRNVTMFGTKSENNYLVVWIRDSEGVTLHGHNGNAYAFPNKTGPDGRRRDGRIAQYMPSLFRVQRSKNVRLANLMDPGRVTAPGESFPLKAGGNGTDPRLWNSVLWQDGDELCDPLKTPDACHATRVLDRPVLWQLNANEL